MKRISFFYAILIIVAALTSSCKNNETDDLNTDKGEKTITFCVANYKQYPMDDVDQANDARSSITRSTAATDLDHLHLSVFDAEGNAYNEIRQQKNDNGYGNFSITLPYGTYTLIFIGYDGSRQVEISSPTDVHFADGYVPNCFYHCRTITVDNNTQASQAIVLERPVACFTLQCKKDDIPTSFAYLNSTIEGCGVRMNALTGLATDVETREYDRDLTQSRFSTDPVNFNFYCFLPATECLGKFTITALDKSGNLIKTRTFNDVPLKINQRTFYNGDFFADEEDHNQESGTSFSLTIGNDVWDEIHMTY